MDIPKEKVALDAYYTYITTYYSELSGEKGSPFVSLLHFKDVQGINNNRLENQGLAIQSLQSQIKQTKRKLRIALFVAVVIAIILLVLSLWSFSKVKELEHKAKGCREEVRLQKSLTSGDSIEQNSIKTATIYNTETTATTNTTTSTTPKPNTTTTTTTTTTTAPTTKATTTKIRRTTAITATNTPKKVEMLYQASGVKYYKVRVAYGTRMVAGAVPDTCEKHGMKSVCEGQEGCAHNTARCKITPLSNCNLYPIYPLSNLLCNGSNPHNCPKTIGLFADHTAGDGACGAVDGNWCARGQDYVSRADKPLYAYCAI